MTDIAVVPLGEEDREWANQWLTQNWGSTRVVSNGVVHDLTDEPGLIAWVEGGRAGMASYQITGDELEVTNLFSIMEGIGVGSALMRAVFAGAREMGCRRIWLVTTNDNAHAFRFYQRLGMVISAVRINGMERARRLKPEIPLYGIDDIPIRDEIEFEMVLGA